MNRSPRGVRRRAALLAMVLRNLGVRSAKTALNMPKMMRFRLERSTRRITKR